MLVRQDGADVHAAELHRPQYSHPDGHAHRGTRSPTATSATPTRVCYNFQEEHYSFEVQQLSSGASLSALAWLPAADLVVVPFNPTCTSAGRVTLWFCADVEIEYNYTSIDDSSATSIGLELFPESKDTGMDAEFLFWSPERAHDSRASPNTLLIVGMITMHMAVAAAATTVTVLPWKSSASCWAPDRAN